MDEGGAITVVRLGHRPGRDERVTTHVGLTARALGADSFVLVADDTDPLDRIADVTNRFGGQFETTQASSLQAVLAEHTGIVLHLTMYGLPLAEEASAIQTACRTDDRSVLIIVGAEKVPFSVYERADWNLAVTNQPHSEIAALGIVLDRLFDPRSCSDRFSGGTHRVVPRACGKQIIDEESPTDQA